MTNYKLSLSKLAVKDVDNAILWYKEQQSGLESKFLDELREHYKRILEYPENYGFYSFILHLRHLKLKRFPYYIFYRIDGKTIRIAGIIHSSRSPDFIRRRYL